LPDALSAAALLSVIRIVRTYNTISSTTKALVGHAKGSVTSRYEHA
jgi:hypothetical protein